MSTADEDLDKIVSRVERVFTDFLHECHEIEVEPGKLNDKLSEIFSSDQGEKINMAELSKRITDEFGPDYAKTTRRY